jgi:hypothetical protein
MIEPVTPPPKHAPASARILAWWFGLMSAAGVAFGLFADKRRFGDNALDAFVIVCAAVALLALRYALPRPAPGLLPDRLLLVGCFVGLAAFLVGNWLALNLAAIR